MTYATPGGVTINLWGGRMAQVRDVQGAMAPLSRLTLAE